VTLVAHNPQMPARKKAARQTVLIISTPTSAENEINQP